MASTISSICAAVKISIGAQGLARRGSGASDAAVPPRPARARSRRRPGAASEAGGGLFSMVIRGSSTAQLLALRVIKRLCRHGRRALDAKNVDGEALAVARQRRRHIAHGDALADPMSPAARGDMADGLSVMQDYLIAHHIGMRRIDDQGDETPCRSGAAFGEHGLAADEIRLLIVDEGGEPGLARRVVGPEILVEGAVILLEPERGEGAA